jgi:hypothetical protein
MLGVWLESECGVVVDSGDSGVVLVSGVVVDSVVVTKGSNAQDQMKQPN